MAKAALWPDTDAEALKLGEQTGLDTLVVLTINGVHLVCEELSLCAPQRQIRTRNPPSPPVFYRISTHFTATPYIPIPHPVLERGSFERTFRVEPGDFTLDTPRRLRALYAQ